MSFINRNTLSRGRDRGMERGHNAGRGGYGRDGYGQDRGGYGRDGYGRDGYGLDRGGYDRGGYGRDGYGQDRGGYGQDRGGYGRGIGRGIGRGRMDPIAPEFYIQSLVEGPQIAFEYAEETKCSDELIEVASLMTFDLLEGKIIDDLIKYKEFEVEREQGRFQSYGQREVDIIRSSLVEPNIEMIERADRFINPDDLFEIVTVVAEIINTAVAIITEKQAKPSNRIVSDIIYEALVKVDLDKLNKEKYLASFMLAFASEVEILSAKGYDAKKLMIDKIKDSLAYQSLEADKQKELMTKVGEEMNKSGFKTALDPIGILKLINK